VQNITRVSADLCGVACAEQPTQAAQMDHSGARTIKINATIFGRSRMNLDSNGARPADWSADSGSPAEASMWCHTLSPAARRLRHHAGE
jgi:hypothetical protein